MLAAIAIIVGLSLLVLIHEFGHFIAAKQAGIKVEEFGFGFPPRIVGIKKGETTYSINWLPFGGFVRIYGENPHRLEQLKAEGKEIEIKRAFCFQSAWRRFVVVAAGIAINFVAGWLLLSLVFMIGAHEAVVITDVQAGSPAATAELAKGDELVGFTTTESFVDFTTSRAGEKVEFTVLHSGEEVTKVIELRKPQPGEGALGVAVSKIGFEKLPFFGALGKGFITSVNAVAQIFIAFGELLADLFGHASLPENIVGPVGIFGVAGDLSKLGFAYLLQLIGLISLNLAALNFIPLPALDGGKILFLIIEKFKGSPVHPVRELWATIISFGFLIILMILITGRDIVRLL